VGQAGHLLTGPLLALLYMVCVGGESDSSIARELARQTDSESYFRVWELRHKHELLQLGREKLRQKQVHVVVCACAYVVSCRACVCVCVRVCAVKAQPTRMVTRAAPGGQDSGAAEARGGQRGETKPSPSHAQRAAGGQPDRTGEAQPSETGSTYVALPPHVCVSCVVCVVCVSCHEVWPS
jgi:hypothetical protein